MTKYAGSCRCGAVTFEVRGEPDRIGLCHCKDCRQESGAAFTFFAVWPAAQFQRSGATLDYKGRSCCATCGSRLFSVDDREAEIKLGALAQAPTSLVPSYELWVKRREPWLAPIEGAVQHDEDRT